MHIMRTTVKRIIIDTRGTAKDGETEREEKDEMCTINRVNESDQSPIDRHFSLIAPRAGIRGENNPPVTVRLVCGVKSVRVEGELDGKR